MISKFSILNGAKCFSQGIFQNYLVCIPAINYINYFEATKTIYSWKCNGMSEEILGSCNFALTFVDHHLLPDINVNGNCLIKNHISILKEAINL